MNILSLFDGISCARVALERAWIKVEKYYASEIDKYAIQVSKRNHPNIIQLWDVNNRKDRDLGEIDIIVWGSPCQWFSFAGKQLAFDDPRSKLFFAMVDIINHYKPKYFLLENVRMKQEYQDVISEYLWVQPIVINSALVSAQNRVRYYWTNIDKIKQPEDRMICLKDIIESWYIDRIKSHCIDANYLKWWNLKSYFEKHRRQLVFCGAMRGRYIVDGKRQDGKMKTAWLTTQRMEIRYDGKTNTITTVQKDNYAVFIDGFRKLTPIECERLQTLPDGYTSCVSNTQRYKALGNWWTVDVVAHILSFIPK